MGVSPDADWLGRLYQSANRLAYLYFLREIGKIDAFLANVYFTGDPYSPTTRQEWDEGIRTASSAEFRPSETLRLFVLWH